jgi:hypothetical protein
MISESIEVLDIVPLLGSLLLYYFIEFSVYLCWGKFVDEDPGPGK